MNHVILSGRLTRDPELVHSEERPICRMRVAVDNGKYPTTYVDVASFDAQAEACAAHLSKGRKVGVSGRLAYSEWRDDHGNRRERYNIVGRVEFLDRPPSRDRDPGPVGTPQPEPGQPAAVPAPPAPVSELRRAAYAAPLPQTALAV